MIAPFRAFVVNQSADEFTTGIQQLEERDLPSGDVLKVQRFTRLSIPSSCGALKSWESICHRLRSRCAESYGKR
jgi:hypothetical protein